MAEQFDIIGAGAIGCFVGGLLQASGADVRFIARSVTAERLRKHGLDLRTFDGRERHLDGDALKVVPPETAPDDRIMLLCVKSMDTLDVANSLKQTGSDAATIISLQNGIDNVARLRTALPGARILDGMVSFNVVREGDRGFAMATEGAIYIRSSPEGMALKAALDASGAAIELREDMEAVQWSKLCLNLNNALNALSGLPLVEQLRDRNWRRLLALCIDECLAVAKARGIAPTRIGKVHPRLVPTVLRLPDFLFERLARQMLAIAPDARTSMASDLIEGRPTEVDFLNGAVVREGEDFGVPTPANQLVTEMTNYVFSGKVTEAINPQILLAKL